MKHLASLVAIAAVVLAASSCDSGGDGQTQKQARAEATRSSKSVPRPNDNVDNREWNVDAGDPGERLDPGEVPPVGSTLELSEREWRERLTKKEYHILREKGTEPPRSGELLHNKRTGIYYCAACGAPVFSSRHKFASGTGWPSFYRTYDPARIDRKPDHSLGMTRTEIVCARCGSHLGHVFDDGPKPTGKRYCINSLALDFKPVEPDEPEASSGGSDER